jgi:hypothetical protein
MFRKEDLFSFAALYIHFFFLNDLKGREGRKDVRVST